MMFTHDALSALPHIRHGFYGRQNGVSQGIYSSLNCAYGSDDNREHVKANRASIVQHIAAEKSLITPYQIHSDICHQVNVTQANLPPSQGDALVSIDHDIILGILTADCTPVLFADRQRPIIAAAHAGWKGAEGGILPSTIEKMLALGSKNTDIVAVLGPTIAQASYEVDAAFRDHFLSRSHDNKSFFIASTKKNHYLFDLPAFVIFTLQKNGIEEVYNLNQDTYTQEEYFFSYRRTTHKQEADYGRQMSVITLVD